MRPARRPKDLYRIILADPHPLIREGVKKILMNNLELKVLGEAANSFELPGLLRNTSPNMVILEISKKFRGIGAISEIKRVQPHVKVLVLTIHKEKKVIHDAFHAGADGYVLKEDPSEMLLSAIESLRMDKTFISAALLESSKEDWVRIIPSHKPGLSFGPLTQRQNQILSLVAEGKSSKEIASLLSISVHTVARHRTSVREKLKIVGTSGLERFVALRDSV